MFITCVKGVRLFLYIHFLAFFIGTLLYDLMRLAADDCVIVCGPVIIYLRLSLFMSCAPHLAAAGATAFMIGLRLFRIFFCSFVN